MKFPLAKHLTATILLLCSLSVNAKVYDFKVGDICYTRLTYNTCEVANSSEQSYSENGSSAYGESDYSGDFVVPSKVTYNGMDYTVTALGTFAFLGCKNLTSITIPNTVSEIGESCFTYCSLSTINLPGSVCVIKDWAFNGCNNLKSITIPEGVQQIEAFAFNACVNLESVSLPSTLGSIGSDVFDYCTSLSTIKVAEGNALYDSRDNCNAVIETGTNNLCCGCFGTVIPSTVTSIGEHAFRYCISLPSIVIPDGVESIGEGAFYYCTSLSSVTLPRTLMTIGKEAFWITNLKSVTIPASVTSMTSNPFAHDDLTSIVVESGNPVYDSRNNCNAVIETLSNNLVVGCSKTVIPDGTLGIGTMAFGYCNALTSIDIPGSVKVICDQAFEGCQGLKSVNIPEGVGKLGNSAFAVYNSGGIESVTLPSSLTDIGYSAFDCFSLTSITDLALNPQSVNDWTFSGLNQMRNDVVLHVLRGCKSKYEVADGWKNFTIVEDAVAPTGIIPVTASTPDSKLYNLAGQCLASPSHGITIVNGKKYLLAK